jgi:tRNA(adenine34) deaminase
MNPKNRLDKDNSYYMSQALAQAKKALERDEVPVGAVIVNPEGKTIAKAYNLVHKKGCQTEHAEMRAIRKVCKKLGDWRLDGHSIYVTLEPCSMCMGLIRLCRISKLIYGADSPLFGYRLDKDTGLNVYKNNAVKIEKGICADQAIALLKHFFKNKREKGGKK